MEKVVGIGGLFSRARNFRVRDLDAIAAQLQAAGIAIEVDAQQYPNGRFARLHDPEGNPIELWQPAGRDAPQDLGRRPHGLQAASTYNGMDQRV
jgi:hypothetical protein